MCTLVILRRPEHAWPVVIGANRDEMIDRPAMPPGRHWPDRTEVVGGLDLQAGGSWLGVNDWGVAAAILNRHGSLGPAAGLRSRGELVLEALDHADAVAAAAALSHLEPAAYRTFNLIVADNRDAFWLRHDGTAPPGAPLEAALRFRTARGFATVSSAVIALPAAPSPERRAIFRFAGWLPEPSTWYNVDVI